jgi:S-methylmethionine-dependent homocysteine/selenocysteine methylase
MSTRRLGLAGLALAAFLTAGAVPVLAAGAPQPLHTLLAPLGISKAEIKDARTRGITLATLATEQSVSREALIDALVAPRYARIDATAAAKASAGAPLSEAQIAKRKAKALALVSARVDRPLALKTAAPTPTP